jgi:hypothetical protein
MGLQSRALNKESFLQADLPPLKSLNSGWNQKFNVSEGLARCVVPKQHAV